MLAALASMVPGLSSPRRSLVTPSFAAQLMTELFPNQPPRQPADVRMRELASLYSGLGAVYLVDELVVLKQIEFPREPRSFEDQRDVDSYFAEAAFYKDHAPRLLAPPYSLRLPRPLRVSSSSERMTLAISKLGGEPLRKGDEIEQAASTLEWLAGLHAAFWGVGEAELNGLHKVGTYWHLNWRLDELSKMPADGWERRLFLAARAIDERLMADSMQTCVHGDLKPANMFFEARAGPSPDGGGGADRSARKLGSGYVSNVFDFQYIGRASPSKDLANFLTYITGACAGADEDALLAHYHAVLSEKLAARGIPPPPLSHLQDSLELAYADLARWMSGWGWSRCKDGLTVRSLALLDVLDGGKQLPDEDAYREAVRTKRPADYSHLAKPSH
jgi:hypothetical protein